jgi:hypothetical protein
VYQTIFFERTKCHLLDWGALYEHCTVLAMQNLFKMGIMGNIENVLQIFYDYFVIILKEHKKMLNLLTWWKQKVVAEFL